MYRTLNSHKALPMCIHETMCNNFVNHFKQKVTTIRSELDHNGQSITIQEVNTPESNIWPEPTRLIAKIPNKSSPLDPLPTWLLKDCATITAPVIAAIANSSYAGKFPSKLRSAAITPILKKTSLDANVLIITVPSRIYPHWVKY